MLTLRKKCSDDSDYITFSEPSEHFFWSVNIYVLDEEILLIRIYVPPDDICFDFTENLRTQSRIQSFI